MPLSCTPKFASGNRLTCQSLQKVFNNPTLPSSHILTYLQTDPPLRKLAIGTSTKVPPTPVSFTQNPGFMTILNEVISEYGHQDEDIISQARALASPGGFNLGSSGASAKGGAGGAGRGGWVHLSDRRNPPDFGRIAWPEDILGSVEVDGSGNVIGKVQPSGTYRLVTNEGM